MTDQPKPDRFTLPGDIPDDSNPPLLFKGGDRGVVADAQAAADGAPLHPLAGRPSSLSGGRDDCPARSSEEEGEISADEAARGYVMAHPAGRGWVPEEDEQIVPGNSPPRGGGGGGGGSALGHGAPDSNSCRPHPNPCPREGLYPSPVRVERSRDTLDPRENKPGPAPIFDPRRQAQFCESLSHNGNVRLACRAAAISPQTAYRARRASPAFARLWDAALLIARRHAEELLAERALNGVEEAVFYHGEVIATRRRYDSRLLLAHLARLDAAAEKAGSASISEHGFDDALGALERGEPYPPPVPAPPEKPEEREEERANEEEDDDDDDSWCPALEEHCLACGAGEDECCRAERFTEDELADRADPAHWVDGEYLDPVLRELRALEAELAEEEPGDEDTAAEEPGDEDTAGDEPKEGSPENTQDPVPGVPGSPESPGPRIHSFPGRFAV